MPLKGHRSNSASRLGRTNSATKVAANLHFTQKDLPVSKHLDKQKKSAGGHANDNRPPFVRVNSSQRMQSREHMQPLKRSNLPPRADNGRAKGGFTIATSVSASEEDEDEDWVSSSSGAATPNNHGSDSETASEDEGSQHAAIYNHRSMQANNGEPSRLSDLARIDTARPTDFSAATPTNGSPISAAPLISTIPPHMQMHQLQTQQQARPTDYHQAEPNHIQAQQRQYHTETSRDEESRHGASTPQYSSLRQSKRSSRPPSVYSNNIKSEIRPHPLIRGQSFGQPILAKTGPQILTGMAAPTLSTSPESSFYDDPRHFLSSSPASTSASSQYTRRSSISSARSVTAASAQLSRPEPPARTLLDRTRTLSTMSTNASSAALSALSHLPSVTRPPSPQSVVFFPPVNPHANIENIHPLLPGPYLNNHLTVLARRIPLRESYDRVIRAKQAM